ncbi:CaiB/BaiF CoA transferase family protein [Mycolicibacterium sp. CBM1]
MTAAASRPFLAGIRVLDITGALAGPYCTTILADLGADVIKVEPVDGDRLRARRLGDSQDSIPFDLVHRGKSSLAVDMKTPTGQDIVRALAARSDVLVENFRVGAMAKLGLSYQDLHGRCPDLVYASISGFGQDGPMRNAKGIDLIAQAFSGLMSVTGSAEGELAKAGFPVSDVGSGMWAAIGILAALLRVRNGGGGSYIDVSLCDSVAAWSLWEVADYAATGRTPEPLGTAHRLAAPYEAFICADRATLVIGAVERAWPALCTVLDLDLTDDARFATEYSRFVHRAALADILQSRFRTAGRDSWMSKLRDAGVPCGPVNTIADIVTDPTFVARGMFLHDEDRFGTPIMVNTPIHAEGAPRARGKAPAIGADTAALLGEIGYATEDVAALASAGIVGMPTTSEDTGT